MAHVMRKACGFSREKINREFLSKVWLFLGQFTCKATGKLTDFEGMCEAVMNKHSAIDSTYLGDFG